VKRITIPLFAAALAAVLTSAGAAQPPTPAKQEWKSEKGFALPTAAPTELLLSPDGKLIAVSVADDPEKKPPFVTWTTLYIFDTATGKQTAKFPRLDPNSMLLAFSPDSTKIAHGGFFGEVQILDLKAGKVTNKFQPTAAKVVKAGMAVDNSGQIMSLAFSPDGKTLASTALHEFVTISDVQTGKQVLSVKHGGIALTESRCAFSTDGKSLYVGVGEEIRVMDIATSKWGTTKKVKGGVSVIASSADSKLAAIGNTEGLAVVFSADLEKELLTFKDHIKKQTPNSIPIFNPLTLAAGRDGTFISTAFDGAVKVWDGMTGKTVASFAAPRQGQPIGYPASITADGKKVAIVAMAPKATVRFWALQEPAEPKK
jgi:WD40 repeat protein